MTDGGAEMRDDGGGYAQPRWLHDDDAVMVDVQSLRDFAERLKREVELNFQPSMRDGIEPMIRNLGKMSPFGRGGLIEGQIFGAAHGRSVEAAGRLLTEALQGLMALQLAAQSIAAEYTDGDAMSKATLDDVADRFNPLEEGVLARAAEANAKNGTAEPADDETAAAQYGASVAPVNPASAIGTGGDVRGTEYIAEGAPGEYVIYGDNEGVEVRLPGSQAPKT